MHIFITGATGWIGSATVDEMLASGHDVVALARSDSSAAVLQEKGARLVRGDLDDLDAIRRGASDSDAVIHLANKHDWSDMDASNAAERAAVEVIGETLSGSGRPFVFASGVAGLVDDRPATEDDTNPSSGPDAPRGGSENRGLDFVGHGVGSIAVRFAPTVHGMNDHGFISFVVAAARKNEVSGYIGDGANVWSAVHRSDAARLVRLGVEQEPAGARLHAVAEAGVSTKAIAEAIGEGLGLSVTSIDPADAESHFGFIAGYYGMDMPATSELTRQLVGWEPTGPTLIADIDAGAYF